MCLDLTHKANKLKQWSSMFVKTVPSRGNFSVLIVTGIDHVSVFDSLGVRMG